MISQQLAGHSLRTRKRMTYVDGYRAVIRSLGYILIAWNSKQEGTSPYRTGDRVEKIWGEYPAPEPLVVIGPGSRAEFAKQMEILKDAGYPGPGVRPKTGYRVSRVGRPS